MKLRDLLVRFGKEMKLGATHAAILSRLQTYPIAQIDAAKLRPSHFIDLARMRRKSVVAATVMLDMQALRSVLSYAPIGWDMADVSAGAIDEAMPKMKQLRLVSASGRRTRIPTAEERSRIKTWVIENYSGDIPIADIIDFQFYSSRRISETCRLQRGDLDEKNKTIVVRNMKHPRHKDGNDRAVALPNEAFDILMRQPRKTSERTERFFPYSSKTISQLYIRIVQACGIDGLTLHDSRRGTVAWLFSQGRSVPHVMLVTGHLTPQMPLTVYNGLKAEDYHKPC